MMILDNIEDSWEDHVLMSFSANQVSSKIYWLRLSFAGAASSRNPKATGRDLLLTGIFSALQTTRNSLSSFDSSTLERRQLTRLSALSPLTTHVWCSCASSTAMEFSFLKNLAQTWERCEGWACLRRCSSTFSDELVLQAEKCTSKSLIYASSAIASLKDWRSNGALPESSCSVFMISCCRTGSQLWIFDQTDCPICELYLKVLQKGYKRGGQDGRE